MIAFKEYTHKVTKEIIKLGRAYNYKKHLNFKTFKQKKHIIKVALYLCVASFRSSTNTKFSNRKIKVDTTRITSTSAGRKTLSPAKSSTWSE